VRRSAGVGVKGQHRGAEEDGLLQGRKGGGRSGSVGVGAHGPGAAATARAGGCVGSGLPRSTPAGEGGVQLRARGRSLVEAS
jgi:hypothetical protein